MNDGVVRKRYHGAIVSAMNTELRIAIEDAARDHVRAYAGAEHDTAPITSCYSAVCEIAVVVRVNSANGDGIVRLKQVDAVVAVVVELRILDYHVGARRTRCGVMRAESVRVPWVRRVVVQRPRNMIERDVVCAIVDREAAYLGLLGRDVVERDIV